MATVTIKSRTLDGVLLALPFAPADTFDGVAFGAVATGLGLGKVAPIVMSATAFSGSAQFASLTVLRDGGGLVPVLIAVFALNARYLVFGASVAPSLSHNRFLRAAQAQLLTDSSWAMSMRSGKPNRQILLGAGAVSYATWILGTALGVALGSAFDYQRLGLDAALPAFFLCVLIGRLEKAPRGVSRVLLAAAVAVALSPVLPAGVPLLIVLIGAMAWRPT